MIFGRALPKGWAVFKLQEVCRHITVGHVGPMADQYLPEGVPFLRSQNIQPFRLALDDVKFISAEFHAKLKKSSLAPGDVAIVRTGYPGTACVIPRSMTIANCADLVIARPSEKLNPWFLAALLNSAWGRGSVAGNLVGVAQQHFNVGAAKAMQVALPPPRVQDRIASILSAYDDMIENNTRRIAILEEMARRIYEEWFVRFRFPGHEGLRMVESELGLVPERWETVRMEDVCARITDGSHYSPKSIDAGKPMASVKDMHDWGINVGTCRQIAEDEYEKLVRNDCKPRLNDVLIAKDGSYLKHTFVVDQEIDLVILSSIAILRPNGRMLPNQLAMYLRLPDVASRMKGYVSGVAIPRIVLRDFRQFLLLLPPADVQRAWATHCDPMLRLCRNLVRKNENLRTTRDLLLPKLISGELDVSAMPEPEALAA